MPALAARYRLPILMTTAAFFIAAPKPAQAQVIDLTGILSTLLDLDTRVTLLGGELVTVNARLSADAAVLAGVSIDLDLLSGRIDGHGLTLIEHAGRLTDIDITLANNNVRIGGNTAAIADLDVRVDGAEVRLDAHDDALASLDTRVAANDLRDDDQDVRIGQAAQTAALARADGTAIRAELAAGTIGLVQQQGPNAAVTVAASTGGSVVSFAGTSGDRRLTGVAAGQAGNDAANVAQMQAGDAATLASANAYTDSSIAGLMDRVGEGTGALIAENNAVLRKDMNAIAAGTSALAGLPQSFIPGRGMMGAAVGGKGDEVAYAMGLSKAFDSAAVPVVRAGAAIDARRGTVSYNASVGFHF
jgi:autotransporter adhesin